MDLYCKLISTHPDLSFDDYAKHKNVAETFDESILTTEQDKGADNKKEEIVLANPNPKLLVMEALSVN